MPAGDRLPVEIPSRRTDDGLSRFSTDDAPMSLPADTLKNRSFIALIVSQFLAGFNDQAIHIAATFYAIQQKILTESDAIFLMQIFFYAPWAIFCTPSAYFADRFSKTFTIIGWKFSEILISLLLILGYTLGTVFDMPIGVWMVVFCVFLMGTHAAFFSPAKYGAMPEILKPHMLSRGNGILESTTFLANILGLVTGGALSYLLRGQEYWIGVVLLGLSIVGAVVSLMMERLPASDPTKEFHFWLPLKNGFQTVVHSRPLALSVLGIAFFVFMVSYMRATMLLHGQTHNPPWTEFHTSLIVAAVALGVGIGSPLAGILSGGKIELGMVPLGCLGMMFASAFAAFFLQNEIALTTALLVIGFFSGFYMVPLYALLQHRAPKNRKGEIVAFSNFTNVTGAMTATALFKALIFLAMLTGLTPVVEQTDEVIVGRVASVPEKAHHHIDSVVIETKAGDAVVQASEKSVIKLPPRGLAVGQEVVVSQYQIGDVLYSVIRPAGEPMSVAYNNEAVPEYLFLGAAGMTLAIFFLLWWKLPDFLVRMAFWFRSIGRHQVRAVGMDNLPTSGPVILATNCDHLEITLQLISATDRHTLVVLAERLPCDQSLLRKLARKSSLVEVVNGADWSPAHGRALDALNAGDLLGVTVDGLPNDQHADDFLDALLKRKTVPIIPVWCGELSHSRVRVVFGEPTTAVRVAELREAIFKLKDWIQINDGTTSDH